MIQAVFFSLSLYTLYMTGQDEEKKNPIVISFLPYFWIQPSMGANRR